jgi:hypothetical protein
VPATTVDHPAKYSKPVMAAIRATLAELLPSGPLAPARVLDPFAGVGGIHQLRPDYYTLGVELEPEWATASDDTQIGDATNLDWIQTGSFDAVVTSPAYGNRMADSYDGARDVCKKCAGSGHDGHLHHEGEVCRRTQCFGAALGMNPCTACGGTGYLKSKRYTYRISLGRELSPNNGAGLQWGDQYRAMHLAAWREAGRVLRTAGLLVINISDHYRNGHLQGVDLWHANACGLIGFELIRQIPVKTTRNGNGSNRELRDSCEWLLVFRNGTRRP